MEFKVNVSLYEPDNQIDPKSWQVGFTIVHSNGVTQYAPVTIYKYQLDDTSKASVLEAAAKIIIPQQVAMAYGKYTQLARQPDFFDTVQTN